MALFVILLATSSVLCGVEPNLKIINNNNIAAAAVTVFEITSPGLSNTFNASATAGVGTATERRISYGYSCL